MTFAPLTAAALLSDLDARLVGQSITCLPECDSTNDRARAAAEAGAPDGAVILAEVQTSGRGQRGRVWLAPPGACLLMSTILRPQLPAADAHLLTMLAACATAAAVESVADLACPLKWPNDLVVGERKVGGILVETSFLGDALEYAVVGIGLNVNLDVGLYPEIAETATSLARELGTEVDRIAVARELLRQLDRRYARLGRGLGEEVYREWRRRLGTLGRQVVVVDHRGEAEAVLAEDVAPDGALIARRADGSRRMLRLGEVSLSQPISTSTRTCPSRNRPSAGPGGW